MRYRWNGVRCVAVTWLLIALSIASTGTGNPAGDSPTGSLGSMRDRIRRHGQVNSTSTPSGWTSQCTPQCFGNISAMELKRNYRLDSVKDDILRKLRMNEPPNVTGRMPDVGLPAMQSLLSQINDSGHFNPDSMDIDRVSPTTFILLSQMVPPDRRSSLPNSCYFTFSPDLKDEHIITAQLGVYINLRNYVTISPNSTAPMTWLLVYRINRNPGGRFYKTLQRRRKISLTPHDTGRWQFFDARILVEYWMRHPRQNYGIQIIASDFRGDPLTALPTANQNEDILRPYIEIQILSQPPNRPRRSTESDCVEANADLRCCRYPLTIDFDVFRWDWVIAPKRYEAYYCSGECPLLYYQRQTHTHVISQLSGGLGVPCCAPTLMSSLQMIYVDSSHNIVFGTLPGMIVERCGCS